MAVARGEAPKAAQALKAAVHRAADRASTSVEEALQVEMDLRMATVREVEAEDREWMDFLAPEAAEAQKDRMDLRAIARNEAVNRDPKEKVARRVMVPASEADRDIRADLTEAAASR